MLGIMAGGYFSIVLVLWCVRLGRSWWESVLFFVVGELVVVGGVGTIAAHAAE